jgi:hypothetical protein
MDVRRRADLESVKAATAEQAKSLMRSAESYAEKLGQVSAQG